MRAICQSVQFANFSFKPNSNPEPKPNYNYDRSQIWQRILQIAQTHKLRATQLHVQTIRSHSRPNSWNKIEYDMIAHQELEALSSDNQNALKCKYFNVKFQKFFGAMPINRHSKGYSCPSRPHHSQTKNSPGDEILKRDTRVGMRYAFDTSTVALFCYPSCV